MQKTKLKPILFIAIQSTYDHVEIALYSETTLVDTIKESKFTISGSFINLLAQLFERSKTNFDDINFIAVNKGPGPFTTLRTVIASVNGLGFARTIPIIGINGLFALLNQYNDRSHAITVALLNAFGNDVYCAMRINNEIKEASCKNIKTLLLELSNLHPQETVLFLGNGAQLHKQEIKETLPAYIPDGLLTCSIQQIAHMGLLKWKSKKDICDQITPIYLKQHPAQKIQ